MFTKFFVRHACDSPPVDHEALPPQGHNTGDDGHSSELPFGTKQTKEKRLGVVEGEEARQKRHDKQALSSHIHHHLTILTLHVHHPLLHQYQRASLRA